MLSMIGSNGEYKRTSEYEVHIYGFKVHRDSIRVLTYDLNDQLLLTRTT